MKQQFRRCGCDVEGLEVGTRIDARLDVVAKTSESGAATVGSPRYLYFYIRPGLFSTSTSGRLLVEAVCLPCSASPVPEGNRNGSTLSQGAQSSWAMPKGKPGPVASQKG